MNEGGNRLLLLLGYISEELVEEAREEEADPAGTNRIKAKKKSGRRRWKAWGTAAAAVACLCVVIAAVRLMGGISADSTGGMYESAQEEAVMDTAGGSAEGIEEEAQAIGEEFASSGESQDGDSAQTGTAQDGEAEDAASASKEDMAEADVAYSVWIDGMEYAPISFEQCKEYGFVSQEADGLTPENMYHIREDDLGEELGTVEQSKDTSMIGAQAYRYKGDSSGKVCIVEMPDGGWEIYVRADS